MFSGEYRTTSDKKLVKSMPKPELIQHDRSKVKLTLS